MKKFGFKKIVTFVLVFVLALGGASALKHAVLTEAGSVIKPGENETEIVTKPTPTPTATPVPTATPTPTPTLVPTVTPTIVPTVTPTIVPTGTPTIVPTVTPTPELTPTVSAEYELGDIDDNGMVDAKDALLVLKHAAKISELGDVHKLASDVNKDGTIDANDALLILKFAARIIDSFN